ncbi:MAG: hypothetical protein NHG14_00845 [Candidatus Shikimatogenerans bostrichidophilus]|nr:MAG: hypothetical protein NHG14_00845 [Candidatus Shikimatogenerans bostrichidophilus]
MLKVIYMSNGTFGIPTLKYLIKKKIKINYIVTSLKKYINNKLNFIKKLATKNNINLINSNDINKKKSIYKIIKSKPNLLILISFKIISKNIWGKIKTINIHPSLLPYYRGPCPINWVIINGEKITGLTSFFVNDSIDNGKIILQKKIKLKKKITFEKLYKKLSKLTPIFLKKTLLILKKKKKKKYNIKLKNNIPYSPKINYYYRKIYLLLYNESYIQNLILGLSSISPAWCYINTFNNITIIYINKINLNLNLNLYKYNNLKIGYLLYKNNKIFLKTKNYFIELLICRLFNKKKMNCLDLYNGLPNKENIFLF